MIFGGPTVSLNNTNPTEKLAYRSSQPIKTQLDGADRYGRVNGHHHRIHFGSEERDPVMKQQKINVEGTVWNGDNRDSRETALQHQIQQLESSNQEKDKQIRDLNNQYERLKARADRLTMELAAAQAYALKPDEYPGNDVLRMVQGLNDDIFNTARSIHDLSAKIPRADYSEMLLDKPDYRDQYRDLAIEAIGIGLYDYNSQIEGSVAQSDPSTPQQFLPLDLALQFVLVRWCSRVASFSRSMPDGLAEAYENIRRQEDQPASARWRVMTQVATSKREQSQADDALRQILAVLCISGMSREQSKAVDFDGKVLKRIQDLEKQVLRLKRVMHEGITSGDMELIDIPPDAIYDPELMVVEDGYDDQKSNVVLCTVGLGLQKVVAKKNAKREVELCPQIMKQATVVLESSLFQELDNRNDGSTKETM